MGMEWREWQKNGKSEALRNPRRPPPLRRSSRPQAGGAEGAGSSLRTYPQTVACATRPIPCTERVRTNSSPMFRSAPGRLGRSPADVFALLGGDAPFGALEARIRAGVELDRSRCSTKASIPSMKALDRPVRTAPRHPRVVRPCGFPCGLVVDGAIGDVSRCLLIRSKRSPGPCGTW